MSDVRSRRILPVVTVVALAVLGACTAADPAAVTADPSVSEARRPFVRMQGCTPGSLFPPAVTGACSRRLAALLHARLVEYDPDTGEATWGPDVDRAMARSVSSFDGRRWRIELKRDLVFHDGEAVTAQSFITAWNHAAYEPNGQPNAFLFSAIEGFDAMRCEFACDAPPDSDELRGLTVLDDYTFLVTLDRPDRLFPAMLGHIVFSPLPQVAYEDPESYGTAPVGSGPFRIDGAVEPEGSTILLPAEDPAGEPVLIEGLEFTVFPDPGAAYRAFRDGELDIVQELPPAVVPDVRAEFNDQIVEAPGDEYGFLIVPAYAPIVGDRRFASALSLAIDRPKLIEEQLEGDGVAARSLVAPVVPRSGSNDTCGVCDHDPSRARRLLEAAGGWPERPVPLWFHKTPENRKIAQDLVEHWRRTFSLRKKDVRLQPLPLSEFVAHLEDRQAPGLQLLGWAMDYPSPSNYLRPLHARGGLFNFDRYEDVQVASLLELAGRASSRSESLELYRQAEVAVLEDLHHIPLWFGTHRVVHSERVANVTLDVFGDVRFDEVTRVAPEG